ncbi:MAG: HNH endonuclease [Paludibacteraceae bacterium]|nr:HNH endonuclease [Paludibacteraceae bacterium]
MNRIQEDHIKLPQNHHLPISSLAGIFGNTTATYKFYWFVALMDIVVKERKTKISFWEIIAGMVAESWYPIHYFKLSFGKSDSLYVQSLALQRELNIPIDADKKKIKQTLIDNLGNSRIKSLLRVFILNVPYRFLSPWIKYTNDGDVVSRSQQFENECLYAIKEESIEMNPKWMDYLAEHYLILRDFAFWNLTVFLQKRNPNVPDVPSKLIKPIQRDSLTKQHKFWDGYIEIVGNINCIYTGKPLLPKQYDLDHFVPWSFVSHNLLWNLIPADSSVNSSKSNHLPSLDLYLEPFADLQQKALKAMYEKNQNNAIFEDYLIVYDSVSELIKLSEKDFYTVLKKTFSPMVQIAENMGFKMWQP